MKILRRYLLLLIGFYCTAVYASSAQLTDLIITSQDEKVQLHLHVTYPVSTNIFHLPNPERLVVDLENTQLKTDLSTVDLQLTGINNIRSAVQAEQTLRIVFDIDNEFDYVLKQSPDAGQAVLIIELDGPEAGLEQVPSSTIVRSADSRTLREVVIVIDPGHGGKDPGAIGPQGTREKNVVLAVAQQLQQILEKEPGVRVVLTRDGDCYLNLRERLTIARENNADLFISIHADAFKDARARGASVFALSQGGATSEAAHWLAERENYSELGGADLSDLDDAVVRSVLLDLSQTATIGASLNLGEQVLEQLGGVARLHSKRVEQAGFVVLKSPDIPSLLVETGFISNPEEELNLGSRVYRAQLAQAVFTGLKAYLWEYAPGDSYIYAWRHAPQYEVVSGDSLSTIAQKHRVSVEEVKVLNGLSSDMIRIGQVLHIPQRQVA